MIENNRDRICSRHRAAECNAKEKGDTTFLHRNSPLVHGRKSAKLAGKSPRRRERVLSPVDRLNEGMLEINKSLVPPIPFPRRECTGLWAAFRKSGGRS